MTATSGLVPRGLVVRGLAVSVGGREIIHGIDLTVAPGEVHAVMGPNGSGKSTLANALLGRPGYDVTAGSIVVDGEDVTAAPTWKRARAGLFLAPQHSVEVPGVDLAGMLEAAGRVPAGDLTARLGEEAARLGLDPLLLQRSVNVDLSGGERKRTEAVQLGVLRPAYCVLDEIDSGLDVDALGAVARRIEQATSEWGLGVVAVTHFVRLLHELRADSVHVLVGGIFVAEGGPELAEELEVGGYASYGAVATA